MSFLENCTALITGASSGIGRELARQLAPCARQLVLVARRADRLEGLRTELTTLYPDLGITIFAVDLAEEPRVDALLHELQDRNIHVDFLINNAGLGDHGPFESSDWTKVRQMLNVNISALTHLTHRLLPGMRKLPQAAILNVSSIASFLPLPDMAVYAATKAYVTSFSEALRAELRGTGITVTALCPGPVSTEFGDVAQRPTGERIPAPEILKVSVEDVAAAALDAVERDRARVVPGLLIAVLMAITAAVPIWILRHFLKPKR